MHHAYYEGMEDQLSALGLVLNCVVLWNTVYLDHAVKTLRQQGYPVLDTGAIVGVHPRPLLIIETDQGFVAVDDEQRLRACGVILHQGLKAGRTALVVGAVPWPGAVDG
jgi:hypothetical protein